MLSIKKERILFRQGLTYGERDSFQVLMGKPGDCTEGKTQKYYMKNKKGAFRLPSYKSIYQLKPGQT